MKDTNIKMIPDNQHRDIPGNPSTAKSSTINLRQEATEDSLRVLSIEQWEFWKQNGYVVIKNAVPAQQAKEVENADALLPGAGNTPIHMEKGVRVPLFAQILAAVDSIAGHGDLALVADLGEAVGERALERLFPDLPKPVTPDVIVDGFRYIWKQMVHDGDPRVRRTGPGRARLWVLNQSTPSLELAGWTAGLLRQALRDAGANQAEVLIILSDALGDGRDLYGVEWS